MHPKVKVRLATNNGLILNGLRSAVLAHCSRVLVQCRLQRCRVRALTLFVFTKLAPPLRSLERASEVTEQLERSRFSQLNFSHFFFKKKNII